MLSVAPGEGQHVHIRLLDRCESSPQGAAWAGLTSDVRVLHELHLVQQLLNGPLQLLGLRGHRVQFISCCGVQEVHLKDCLLRLVQLLAQGSRQITEQTRSSQVIITLPIPQVGFGLGVEGEPTWPVAAAPGSPSAAVRPGSGPGGL